MPRNPDSNLERRIRQRGWGHSTTFMANQLSWHPKHLQRLRAGLLPFTPQEAELLARLLDGDMAYLFEGQWVEERIDRRTLRKGKRRNEAA